MRSWLGEGIRRNSGSVYARRQDMRSGDSSIIATVMMLSLPYRPDG